MPPEPLTTDPAQAPPRPRARRLWQRLVWREHRPHPGDVLLGIAAAGAWASALILVTFPERLSNGPALATLYALPGAVGLPGRATWAVAWALVALAPTAAVVWPSVALRKRAFEVLLPAGLCWTVGLAWPLVLALLQEVTHAPGPPLRANALAPLAWLVLTSAGFTIWALIPLDAPFYRPVRSPGSPAPSPPRPRRPTTSEQEQRRTPTIHGG